MLARLRSHVSYANAVGSLALFLALGGGAYALDGASASSTVFHGCVSKTTGALRVVSGTANCHGRKKRHGHVDPGEFAIQWNQQGPPGRDGTDGVNGTNGANGTNGTNGTNGGTTAVVRSRTFTLSTGDTESGQVNCNPGERAVGGGIVRSGGPNLADRVSASGPAVSANFQNPAQDGDTPTAWVGGVAAAASGTYLLSVICVSP